MDQHTKDIMVECAKASDEERITFPEVVKALMGAGVERYLADLTRGERTFHMPDGESLVVEAHRIVVIPAQEFSADGVEAALRAIQGGKIQYREFCERIAKAGCVSYIVSLAGKRAVYFGRTGDLFVERFPQAKKD